MGDVVAGELQLGERAARARQFTFRARRQRDGRADRVLPGRSGGVDRHRFVGSRRQPRWRRGDGHRAGRSAARRTFDATCTHRSRSLVADGACSGGDGHGRSPVSDGGNRMARRLAVRLRRRRRRHSRTFVDRPWSVGAGGRWLRGAGRRPPIGGRRDATCRTGDRRRPHDRAGHSAHLVRCRFRSSDPDRGDRRRCASHR